MFEVGLNRACRTLSSARVLVISKFDHKLLLFLSCLDAFQTRHEHAKLLIVCGCVVVLAMRVCVYHHQAVINDPIQAVASFVFHLSWLSTLWALAKRDLWMTCEGPTSGSTARTLITRWGSHFGRTRRKWDGRLCQSCSVDHCTRASWTVGATVENTNTDSCASNCFAESRKFYTNVRNWFALEAQKAPREQGACFAQPRNGRWWTSDQIVSNNPDAHPQGYCDRHGRKFLPTSAAFTSAQLLTSLCGFRFPSCLHISPGEFRFGTRQEWHVPSSWCVRHVVMVRYMNDKHLLDIGHCEQAAGRIEGILGAGIHMVRPRVLWEWWRKTVHEAYAEQGVPKVRVALFWTKDHARKCKVLWCDVTGMHTLLGVAKKNTGNYNIGLRNILMRTW